MGQQVRGRGPCHRGDLANKRCDSAWCLPHHTTPLSYLPNLPERSRVENVGSKLYKEGKSGNCAFKNNIYFL